ncbi:MOSC domain-containing protein [Bosea sp. (in: a-proteobacteria)]|uniref:MOSC domain-containing protein n=1 Tax=Bosea sp. (in: a-proteobacteria) TaxID=1871050 RepID=UPI0035627EB9
MTQAAFAGAVSSLWRYPISSMGGERLQRAPVAAAGVEGDRIWGLLDGSTGRIASPGREKHFIEVPRGHARFTGDGVAVSSDGARWAAPDDPRMLREIAGVFGFNPVLKPFGPFGAEGFRPRYEHAPIHVITTAGMRSLERDHPGSVIEERRFRPNLVVDWPDEAEAMPEQGWIGREIRIGEVVLRGSRPCGRCGFITIEQEAIPLDIEILRTVVKRYERNFGIYCDVLVPGEIRAGDRVSLS